MFLLDSHFLRINGLIDADGLQKRSEGIEMRRAPVPPQFPLIPRDPPALPAPVAGWVPSRSPAPARASWMPPGAGCLSGIGLASVSFSCCQNSFTQHNNDAIKAATTKDPLLPSVHGEHLVALLLGVGAERKGCFGGHTMVRPSGAAPVLPTLSGGKGHIPASSALKRSSSSVIAAVLPQPPGWTRPWLWDQRGRSRTCCRPGWHPLPPHHTRTSRLGHIQPRHIALSSPATPAPLGGQDCRQRPCAPAALCSLPHWAGLTVPLSGTLGSPTGQSCRSTEPLERQRQLLEVLAGQGFKPYPIPAPRGAVPAAGDTAVDWAWLQFKGSAAMLAHGHPKLLAQHLLREDPTAEERNCLAQHCQKQLIPDINQLKQWD